MELGSLKWPLRPSTSTGRTAKWYLFPSWNCVKVQAMGRGNAFTSPTYNKDKYSLKEKLKIDFKNSLMSERGTKRFSKVQVFVWLALWIKFPFLLWEEMPTFFHRVVLGVEVPSWYANSWYDAMSAWGVSFRVIFHDSTIPTAK